MHSNTLDTPLLDVRNLTVSFGTPAGVVEAVRGVSFRVSAGKTLAIVGESGSGKSAAMHALVGLARGARISGDAAFDGRNLLAMTHAELRAIRGAQIAMVFQDPQSSLHPFFTVGAQIAEAILVHERTNKADARQRAVALLETVGIANAARRADDFPHQFSGGMLQRAMIAMAVALKPRVLIADEPTTALDVTVQSQIIALLRTLQAEFGLAVVLITHDLGVVADFADDVLVMYGGQVMERAARRELFHHPQHPYTQGLFASLPSVHETRERLTPIRGQPPSLINPGAGCPFQPRCDSAFAQCATRPSLISVSELGDHASACWLEARGTASVA